MSQHTQKHHATMCKRKACTIRKMQQSHIYHYGRACQSNDRRQQDVMLSQIEVDIVTALYYEVEHKYLLLYLEDKLDFFEYSTKVRHAYRFLFSDG